MKIEDVKPPNFVDEGDIFLVRCPKCGRENYAPAVATGQCAWCGFDANENTEPSQEIKESKK